MGECVVCGGYTSVGYPHYCDGVLNSGSRALVDSMLPQVRRVWGIDSMELSIEGRSDDTIGCYGLPASRYRNSDGIGSPMDDIDTCGNNQPPPSFVIQADKERCRVHAIYTGCWQFAIGQVDEEDGELPDWAMNARLFQAHEYCVGIRMNVPDNATVTWERD